MKEAGLLPAKNRHTTQAAIERELDTIADDAESPNQVEPIATEQQVNRLLLHRIFTHRRPASGDRKTGLSSDQYIAWQGVAGAGKTYSLRLLTQLAREQGYEVTGYAPSAQAANVLSEEANIESNTVARLLHSNSDTSSQNNPSEQLSESAPRTATKATALDSRRSGTTERQRRPRAAQKSADRTRQSHPRRRPASAVSRRSG